MGEFFTLKDLETNPVFSTRTAETTPPFFAVFGKPIGHSMSPIMQNVALNELAKTNSNLQGARYFAFEIAPEDLKEAIALFHSKNFLGINLTIPHKEIIMGMIEDFDSSASIANACNTLLRTKDSWKGFNTDGFGLEAAIEYGLDRAIKNSRILIIGAGGAGRGAAFYIAAKGCKSLAVANRSQERLERLVHDLDIADFESTPFLMENLEEKILPETIIVNATSIGLKSDDKPILDFTKVHKDCVFFDMPYRRGAETVSVIAARENSIAAQSGLPMLAWQGAKSLSIWTGENPPLGHLMLKTLEDDFNANS